MLVMPLKEEISREETLRYRRLPLLNQIWLHTSSIGIIGCNFGQSLPEHLILSAAEKLTLHLLFLLLREFRSFLNCLLIWPTNTSSSSPVAFVFDLLYILFDSKTELLQLLIKIC